MEPFCTHWQSPPSRFGDAAVLAFLVVQVLDGAMTYLGIAVWGPSIEANPIISSAVTHAGAGMGLFAAKLVAVGFGIMLHLRGVHTIVAALTALYLTLAIAPWTALFLLH